MATQSNNDEDNPFAKVLADKPTIKDQQIEELQEALTNVQDARKEDAFIFIVITVLLFNIMIFTVMPNFGGPLAILILELLILIPLAKRMGMQEIAKNLDRVLSRMADRSTKPEDQ